MPRRTSFGMVPRYRGICRYKPMSSRVFVDGGGGIYEKVIIHSHKIQATRAVNTRDFQGPRWGQGFSCDDDKPPALMFHAIDLPLPPMILNKDGGGFLSAPDRANTNLEVP